MGAASASGLVAARSAEAQMLVGTRRTTLGVNADARYLAAVLPDSPWFFYRMNETSGTTIIDYSGNGRNGVYSSAVKLGVPGVLPNQSSGAAQFNDSSTCYSYSGSMVTNPNPFTYEAWVRVNAPGGQGPGCFFGLGTPTGPPANYSVYDRHLAIGQGTDQGVIFFGWGSSDSGFITSPSASYGVGTFHIVATYSSTLAAIYVNGARVASQSNPSTSPQSYTGQVAIGGCNGGTGSTYNEFFQGVIGNAAFYLYALSPARIAAHYAAGIA